MSGQPKKICLNCFYFDSDRKHKNGGWECELHENAKIAFPSTQFCGDEYWISNLSKLRNQKLDRLGI